MAHVTRHYGPKSLENKSAYYVAPELFQSEDPTTACDVYSLGILSIYILNNGQDPYTISSFTEFKDHVGKGKRPELPAISSPQLLNLITDWWQPQPTERPPFQPENDPIWNNIIEEIKTHGQKEVGDFWNRSFKQRVTGEILPEVPWNIFASAFSKFLQISEPDLRSAKWKCRGVLLEVVQKDNMVTKHNFFRLVDWFGPVRTGIVEGAAFLHQFETLFKMDWFHGSIGNKEAERRLILNKQDKTFLVRFSSRTSTYTMTIRDSRIDKKKLIHERFPLGSRDVRSLINWVERDIKHRSLKPCSYGRNFDHLFDPYDISISYSFDRSIYEDKRI
jgi:serine/threonine protein kinase